MRTVKFKIVLRNVALVQCKHASFANICGNPQMQLILLQQKWNKVALLVGVSERRCGSPPPSPLVINVGQISRLHWNVSS